MVTEDRQSAVTEPAAAARVESRLRAQVETLERRLRERDEQRRAMLHIMGDLNEFNKRLANQRKAMLHILADYEQDRRRLARQTDRLDNSRRAVLHILQDSHKDKLRLEASRKAMIHIMGNLRETTAEVQGREQELRDKQEQLVQAGKLATLGEQRKAMLHILQDSHRSNQRLADSRKAMIHIMGDLRETTVEMQRREQELRDKQEQLRLHEIEVTLDLGPEEPVVVGNPIQLEQVFINLLANARDAVLDSPRKAIRISASVGSATVEIAFVDTGHGIPSGLEQRIFDPFFTTKEVGKGTGLGLSITYGIVKEHGGTISVVSTPGEGATFLIQLPLAGPDTK